MTDNTQLKVKTAESVAFELANRISNKEGLDKNAETFRKEFLDLYAECLQATKNNRVF